MWGCRRSHTKSHSCLCSGCVARRSLPKSYSSKDFSLKKNKIGHAISFHLANVKVFRKKKHLYTKCLCFLPNRCLGMADRVLYILNHRQPSAEVSGPAGLNLFVCKQINLLIYTRQLSRRASSFALRHRIGFLPLIEVVSEVEGGPLGSPLRIPSSEGPSPGTGASGLIRSLVRRKASGEKRWF